MFDILVLLVLGLSTAFAALRGGLRELSTLIALAIAGGLTLIVAEPMLAVTGLAGSFFGTIIVAAVLVAVFFIVAHVGLHLGLQRVPLEGRAKLADRIGGGVFGFVRGLVLVGLGYLGYGYYLDEARQPESVKSAITRPVAAGMANWFQSFTPDEAYIESAPTDDKEDDKEDEPDPAESGYDRLDRNSLSEIVTTVTTSDETPVEGTPGTATDETDSIADILQDQEEDPQ
ncbi:MAG: CvpA family protein [Pseudomonadota bacterium]